MLMESVQSTGSVAALVCGCEDVLIRRQQQLQQQHSFFMLPQMT